jgi:D-alanine-D-alanine ligase-like ATP-grasp enzyme
MMALRRINQAIYSWISKRYMSGCSSYNTLAVRKSCRSKEQARSVFEKNSIPHAKGQVFFNPWVAIRFAKIHGFPLVVKPNVSGYSRGSYFPIENYKQLWKAIFLAKIWWPTTVIEQYLLGKNYRVVVIDGQLMSVIQRFQPMVIGDGISTIEELIDVENSARTDLGLLDCMYAISKDKKTIKYLASRGLKLTSIEPMGKTIELHFRISLAPGGTVDVVDKATISDVNKALFLRVLSLFDANILGVDVIFSKGIETPYTDQECIFLEVNSRPYLKMHDYPRHTKKEDLTPYYEQLARLTIEDANVY